MPLKKVFQIQIYHKAHKATYSGSQKHTKKKEFFDKKILRLLKQIIKKSLILSFCDGLYEAAWT